MSKYETPLTLKFWEQTGGTLIEEYHVVKKTKESANRWIDGVILPKGKKERLNGIFIPIEGEDVICIQTKKGRLGMYLLGQCIISKLLLENHKPKSIRNIAICTVSDKVMEIYARQFGIEVIVF